MASHSVGMVLIELLPLLAPSCALLAHDATHPALAGGLEHADAGLLLLLAGHLLYSHHIEFAWSDDHTLGVTPVIYGLHDFVIVLLLSV